MGFEPTVLLLVQRFSRPPRSTTPAPLRMCGLGVRGGVYPSSRQNAREKTHFGPTLLDRRPARAGACCLNPALVAPDGLTSGRASTQNAGLIVCLIVSVVCASTVCRAAMRAKAMQSPRGITLWS